MSIFSDLFGGLWKLIKGLFESTATEFNKLPKEQQDAAFTSAQISQILKDNIGRGETYIKDVITSRLGLSADVVNGLFDSVAKDLNYDNLIDGLSNRISQGITDNAHNALFEDIAKFTALFLSAGTLNWITLALGMIEYAYQWLKGNDKLIKPINTAALKQSDDTGGLPPNPTSPGGH